MNSKQCHMLGRSSPPLSDQKWDTLIRDLPMECIDEMGSKLSMSFGKNFKDLAGLLDFSLHEVEKIKRESSANPGRRLLNIWSQRDGTTARALKRYLEHLGRYDVRRDLMKALSEPVNLVVVVKDERDNSILYDGVLNSFGQESVRDALESEDKTKQLMPFRDADSLTLESKAANFKGRQITVYRSMSGEKEPCVALETEIFQPDRERDVPLRMSLSNSKLHKATLNYPSWTPVKDTPILTTSYSDRAERITMAVEPQQVRQRPDGQYDLRPPVDTQSTQISATTQSSLMSETFKKTRVAPDSRPGISPMESKNKRHTDTQKKFVTPSGLQVAQVPPFFSHTEGQSSRSPLETTSGTKYTGVSLDLQSVDEGVYITTTFPTQNDQSLSGFQSCATNTNIIQHLFLPHLHEDGTYITRPSREDPSARSISVVFEGEVVNYRIHSKMVLENGQWFKRYYLFEGEHIFASMDELINFFRRYPMKSRHEEKGPILKNHL